jgi:hypothetical protein
MGLALLPWVVGSGLSAAPPGAGEASHCADCHQQEQLEFERSRMAMAADTVDFLSEWEGKGRVGRCLACHAPSGGRGLVCRDCHGDSGHPYAKLATPQVCARCHDAPGESTVRSFLRSPAASRERGCLDCHQSEEGGGHDFMGPTRAGFLEGVARLRLALRKDAGGDRLLVRISHRAGHALPGGTTGRSVWLVVETFARGNRRLAESLTRFGWYHDATFGWQDWTLPPGPGKVVEIPIKRDDDTVLIRARLIYRFRPGLLEDPDPREVVLDQAQFALPSELGESQ